MVTNTWNQYNSAWYYLGPDGAMCKSQLLRIPERSMRWTLTVR
ncbi:hypothetical protein [Lacrimispora sp. 38-1]